MSGFHWPVFDQRALLAATTQMKGLDSNSNCTQYSLTIFKSNLVGLMLYACLSILSRSNKITDLQYKLQVGH